MQPLHPFRLARKSLPFLMLAGLAGLVPSARAQDPGPASVVTATLSYVSGLPGAEIYQYDYTVENLGVVPDLHAFLVFFDADLTTMAFDGTDDMDFVSAYGPNDNWTVDAIEPAPADAWYVEFDNYSTAGIEPGETLGTYSIRFLWKNPDIIPPIEQFYEVFNGMAHEDILHAQIISTAPRNGTIQGQVTSCDGTPLYGITVDLYTLAGDLARSTFTNTSGNYVFASVPPGSYTVNIVSPIGYTVPDELPNSVRVNTYLDFHLECQTAEYSPRTIGFWKHQPNVYLTGQGKAQVTKTQLVSYLDGIYNHFAVNPVHPVSVYTLAPTTYALTKLNTAQDILTVSGGANMNLRARQQLMALLLNVVSLKLGINTVCSADGRTVNQAITYAWDLIADGNPANDELAKTIADEINNDRKLGAGIIPGTVPVIAYDRAVPDEPPSGGIAAGFGLGQNYPNPSTPATRIPFVVPANNQATVAIGIFDLNGRLVTKLVDGSIDPGRHEVTWDGTNSSGQPVPSGVYFYRMSAGSYSETRKLQVLR